MPAMLLLEARLQLGERSLFIGEAYDASGSTRTGPRVNEPVSELSERLYVGSLPFEMTESDLRALFVARGLSPEDISMSIDRKTGRSRGFAFVSMRSKEAADESARCTVR